MSETKFKIVDLFCGMGNFRAGFELAGAECVYSVEFDKYKRQIYKVIYGEEPNANDIRNVEAGDIPYADCWCFGAPCQDFSMAGERAGLDGSRSSLVREVFRLLGEKEPEDRPEWLVYENVRGMLSSNKGWDFAAILTEFYRGGMTQNGEYSTQSFSVCHRIGKECTLSDILEEKVDEKYFLSETAIQWLVSLRDVKIEDLKPPTHTHTHIDGNAESGVKYVGRKKHSQAVQRGLSDERQGTESQRVSQEVIQIAMCKSERNNPNRYRVYSKYGIAPCLNKAEGGGRTPYIYHDEKRRHN